MTFQRCGRCALASFLLALSVSVALPVAAVDDSESVRWASLLPFVGTALRGAGPEYAPVAEVRASMHQPPPAGAADLGSAHQPNFEVLVGSRPAFVVGDRVLHASLVSKLEPAAVELVLLDTSSIDGTLDGLARVAERVGASGVMATDLTHVRQALAEIEIEGDPEVLPLYGVPGRYLLLTEQTWVGDLITSSGGRLTSPEGLAPPSDASSKRRARHPGYIQVSDEWLTAQRPDAVLLLSHGDPAAIAASFRKRIAEGGAWAPLAESTGGRVYALSPALFSTNPGLGLAEAAQELRRVLGAPPAVAAGPTQ